VGYAALKRLRTIALLARRPGLVVLTDALLGNSQIELVGVYTHSKLPKAEGGGHRPEAAVFEKVCAAAAVPLQVLDWPEARCLETCLPAGPPLDLMVVLSWRFLVAPSILANLRIGGLNIHRGALPDFKGTEPVRRAIEAGERRIAVTAQRMTGEIDVGATIAVAWMDIDPLPPGVDVHGYAEEVKSRLEPVYAPLARTAIAAVSG
jgi:methionyl-tRNA formyltransferase